MSPALRAEVARTFLAEARAATDPAEAHRLCREALRIYSRTLRIVAPSFVAGAVVGPDGLIVTVAPILARHVQGLRTGRDLREYASRRGWSATYIEAP